MEKNADGKLAITRIVRDPRVTFSGPKIRSPAEIARLHETAHEHCFIANSVRTTIVVGGELTMANLEVMLNTVTGISEAPLQLKSNCGTLVIDDFGRQTMSTE